MNSMIPAESITNKIYLIRGHNVLLDRNLAELYNVETITLKQADRRNIKRFPEDFMFELSKEEFKHWRSQFVISNADKKGLRHTPMAFTEQGVAMLSSVLKSDRAIEVNIAIMRTFVEMRQLLSTHKELKKKIEEMEAKYDEKFQVVFEAISASSWQKRKSRSRGSGFRR